MGWKHKYVLRSDTRTTNGTRTRLCIRTEEEQIDDCRTDEATRRRETYLDKDGDHGSHIILYVRMSVHSFFIFCLTFTFPASGQAVVSGVVSSPQYVPSVFIAHRVQHSHCSSTSIECCLLTLSRFPRVNWCSRKNPYEFIRVCTREDSKSRSWPIACHLYIQRLTKETPQNGVTTVPASLFQDTWCCSHSRVFAKVRF